MSKLMKSPAGQRFVAFLLGVFVATHGVGGLIPGFARHWDFKDLLDAMGKRSVLWTDPTNWMNQVVRPGPSFRYRHEGETDEKYLKDFLEP